MLTVLEHFPARTSHNRTALSFSELEMDAIVSELVGFHSSETT